MPFSPAVYENLAKRLVYIDDNPQLQAVVQGGLTAAGYRLDRTFDDPATGFHAIGLISTTPDKPPVMVFRGGVENRSRQLFFWQHYCNANCSRLIST